MRFWSILPRALATLAVVGLLLNGFAAPVAAKSVGAPATMAMADGMPPCDENAPDCGDMTSCAFMVVCVAKRPQGLPTASSFVERDPLMAVNVSANELLRPSLAIPPLPRPPQA